MDANDRLDVAIVGGGMVGLSLGLLLGAHLGRGARIALLEEFALPEAGARRADTRAPSFDGRSTALAYGSQRIYDELGLWDELARRACPIERIHVSERGRFGSALLSAAEQGWAALGYVVENAWLGNCLARALRERQAVRLLSPARVADAACEPGGYALTLADASRLHAGLLVVADGADSALCARLGIAARRRSYRRHALIANIAHREPHRQCAYERFTDQGPLALLPLPPDARGRQRSALVWTLPANEADSLLACPEPEFLRRLQLRFGYRLGALTRVTGRASYPLGLVQAEEQVRQHLVVLGNAARTLHPVAGQGFNLALRDCAALAERLAAALAAGRAAGALATLQDYLEARREDQRRALRLSDRLPGLFAHPHPLLGGLRDMGLFALDLSPRLKRGFVRHAAGMAAPAAGRHDD